MRATMRELIPLVLVVASGCSRAPEPTAAAPSPEPARPVQTKAEPAEPVPETSSERRLQWLRDVDALVADIQAGPAPLSAELRTRLDKLVASPEARAVWDVDASAFGGEDDSVLRFAPRIKALIAAVTARGTVDDAVHVALFEHHTQIAFVRAGESFIDGLPGDDASRAARLHGLDQTRLGDAIVVCGLLFMTTHASQDLRDQVVAELLDEDSYAHLGKQHLQLIVATLDESVPAVLPPKLAPDYARIRDFVESLRAAHPARRDGLEVTYQGIIAVTNPRAPTTVVSRTGGFSVVTYPRALASRVASATMVQHRVDATAGNTTFEAVCVDGATAEQLAARVAASGVGEEREGDGPGTWFEYTVSDRAGGMRILDIGDRGCAASVEAPPGQLDPLAPRFLSSLRAAPAAN